MANVDLHTCYHVFLWFTPYFYQIRHAVDCYSNLHNSKIIMKTNIRLIVTAKKPIPLRRYRKISSTGEGNGGGEKVIFIFLEVGTERGISIFLLLIFLNLLVLSVSILLNLKTKIMNWCNMINISRCVACLNHNSVCLWLFNYHGDSINSNCISI